ncbi:hypothetical protein NQ176_g5320 [Zarea fungicola]|uniref:Uncharacterized protein n=1 Tax=Zarea fungicola TaxID=93591 RepID=A0ACC1N9N7_9HYPO|nr:hypothetical protein NQ176_g5320 [Lecanicillium fungicola]
MRRFASLVLASITAGVAASPVPDFIEPQLNENDFSCRSSVHPYPIVSLHGILANNHIALNFLESWLRPQGYCTFSLTYGTQGPIPIGGVKSIEDSSHQIADFIQKVLDRTGAEKVDIIGHSEGALLSLYVPKFSGLAPRINKVIAIAPPTHGTTLGGVTEVEKALGIYKTANSVFGLLGCAACEELGIGAPAIRKLNTGPIAQPGNEVTVIASRTDEVITPLGVEQLLEPGVHNMWVQDYCPDDHPGHLGLLIDTNVWELVRNSLEDQVGRKFKCASTPSVPIRRRLVVRDAM